MNVKAGQSAQVLRGVFFVSKRYAFNWYIDLIPSYHFIIHIILMISPSPLKQKLSVNAVELKLSKDVKNLLNCRESLLFCYS